MALGFDMLTDDISKDAWVARYASELERLGMAKPFEELLTAGRVLWATARNQRPEELAFCEWRALFAAAGAVTCH